MVPKTLYKYRSWRDENHQKILTKDEIFLSSVRLFNDPREYTIPVNPTPPTKKDMYFKIKRILEYDNPGLPKPQIKKMGDEEFESFLKQNPNPTTWFNYEHAQNRLKDNFGVCSLSVEPLNYDMWSVYGDSAQGFCVGLDFDKLTEFYQKFNLFFLMLEKVNYTQHRLTFNHLDFVQADFDRFLTTKSEEWSYEKEYRLISCRTKNSKVTNPTNIALALPTGVIKKVFVGWKMSSTHVREIRTVLKERELKITLCRVRKSSTLYLEPVL